MNKIIVLAQHQHGHVLPETAAALAVASELGTPTAVLVTLPDTDTGALVGQLGQLGAAGVYTYAGADQLVTPLVDALDAALEANGKVTAVLLPETNDAREAGARLAVRREAGYINHASDVQFIDGRCTVTQQVLGGDYTVTSTASPDALPIIGLTATIREEPAAAVASPVVTALPTVEAAGARIMARQQRASTSNRPDLRSAKVVIAAGRGVGRGGYPLVEQLADAMGGAVGATRAAVDAGYCEHNLQVGQTGVTVSPDVYIGAGVSGAIQHQAGMQSARHIIAINTDEDAPIMEIADLGVVGDAVEIIPQLIEELSNR